MSARFVFLFLLASLAVAGQSAPPVPDSKLRNQSGTNSSSRVSTKHASRKAPNAPPVQDDQPPSLTPVDLVPSQAMFPDLPPRGTPYGIGGWGTPPTIVLPRDAVLGDADGKAKQTRTVVLELIVTPAGVPQDIKVVKSIGAEFDTQAIEAVKKWKFEPATKEGRPVAVKIRVEVKFALY